MISELSLMSSRRACTIKIVNTRALVTTVNRVSRKKMSSADETEKDTVRVAVTQVEPEWLDLQGTVAKTCKYITEAAHNDAQIIAFPEVFISGYPTWI